MPVNIPTEWLPAYKFACAHLNWGVIGDDFLAQLRRRSNPKCAMPSTEELNKLIRELIDSAEKDPDNNYCLILVAASHGYHYDGF